MMQPLMYCTVSETPSSPSPPIGPDPLDGLISAVCVCVCLCLCLHVYVCVCLYINMAFHTTSRSTVRES